MTYYVYLLQSLKNQSTYVGFTQKQPDKRLKEHNKGSNKHTSKNLPYKLVYWEKFHCKKDAMSREKFFKSGQGKKLKNIIVKYF